LLKTIATPSNCGNPLTAKYAIEKLTDISSSDIKSTMKTCTSWKNVRPLEAKVSKFTEELIIKHENTVNYFIARRTKG
jgi:hypothetical protein